MRPRSRRKGKTFGPHLDGQGDEHPGVGAEGLGRGDHCLGASVGATSRVVMDSRWTAPCLMLSLLARLFVTSRAAMDTGTSGPRTGGTGRLAAGRTSRMAGDLAVVVPRGRGSGRVPVCSTSRMAG
jgi:hypothetical protein